MLRQNFKVKAAVVVLLTSSIVYTACKKSTKEDGFSKVVPIEIINRSVNPALIKAMPGFESLKITTLISSDDVLPESPGFLFGAQPDGGAFVKNPSGEGFIMINNHEVLFSVSRVFLDKNLKPVKGEYIVDAEGGQWRLCSATLATPAEHGFGPVFLTAGESGSESMTHAIDIFAPADKKNKSRTVSAFGKWRAENVVPLPKDAYTGKSVVIIGEDSSNGQLIAYVSNTVGDLSNGKLYGLRRTGNNPVETDMSKGTSYDVEFVEFDNVKTSTGAQLDAQSVAKNMIQFARVEDIDYTKGGNGAGREVYFTATGVSQADKVTPVMGKNMWGRVYKLSMNATNPLVGKLEIIIDGGDNPGKSIVNPDNICVTQNFVYTQEDGDSFYRDNDHDGIIWQYDISTKTNKAMLIMNHNRTDVAFNTKYNSANFRELSSWEYGAMIDISDVVGIPDTFMINVQPHTWSDNKYKNADGSGLTTNTEGGQTLIVRGIKK